MHQKKINTQLNIFDLPNPNIFRPIHYLGSKLRILNSIEKTINDIDKTNGAVCDLFAGSGTVSYKLSQSRNVTAVDIQNYSNIICSAILSPLLPSQTFITEFLNKCKTSRHSQKLLWSVSPLSEYEKYSIKQALLNKKNEDLSNILENGSIIAYQTLKEPLTTSYVLKQIKEVLNRLNSKKLQNQNSLAIRYFGGLYFSYLQAAHIDSILYQISNVPKKFKNFFLAALLSTVSDIVNTIGKQFAQPIRPRKTNGEIKPSLGKMTNKDRSLDVLFIYKKWLNQYKMIQLNNHNHQVLKMDYSLALNQLPKETTVVYADPPYTRDHYSRFYHVLETISLRDTPNISTVKLKGKTLLSRGLYRQERHQSPFCIRSQAPNAFNTMFLGVKNIGAKLVLSYSPFSSKNKAHPRVVDIDFLQKLGKKHFSNVEIISVGNFTHSKLNHSDKHLKASNQAELLIVCE